MFGFGFIEFSMQKWFNIQFIVRSALKHYETTLVPSIFMGGFLMVPQVQQGALRFGNWKISIIVFLFVKICHLAIKKC
jgi:hypothetical protein